MQIRQTDFFAKDREQAPHRVSHGGDLRQGRRKICRPLDHKKPLHLVLKSSFATGRLSFLTAKNRLFVEATLRAQASRKGLTIHSFQNVGNHLHLIIRFSKRLAFQNFLRTVTALIARFVTGARRGKPFGKRFWDELAFTRVLTGFKDFRAMQNYLIKNEVERKLGAEMREAVEVIEAKRRKMWAHARAILFSNSSTA